MRECQTLERWLHDDCRNPAPAKRDLDLRAHRRLGRQEREGDAALEHGGIVAARDDAGAVAVDEDLVLVAGGSAPLGDKAAQASRHAHGALFLQRRERNHEVGQNIGRNHK